jgi:NagD protein
MRKGYLIDMDGVLYKGSKMIESADIFINQLNKNNIPYLFLTNNSRSTQRDIAFKLEQCLGVNVLEDQIFTSAMATAYFLTMQKDARSVYILGEGGLITSVYDAGYAINEQNADYVVVGESRTLNLDMIEKAIDMIIGGAKLIATNLDPAPREVGWPKPGTGAVVAMIEEATGIKAFSVGKPSPIMMRAARKRLKLTTDQTVMIGDTMETDILGGVNMGFDTVLTLSGVTQKSDLKNYAFSPGRIVDSIADLIGDLEGAKYVFN